MLFDRRCPGCRRPARRACQRCIDVLTEPPALGRDGALASLAAAAGLDRCQAAFSYDPRVSRILLAAKNGGRRDILAQLARWLPVPDEPVDVVTWVPASRRRRRQRGYDQGKVLAQLVGPRVGAPSRRLLARPRSDAQAGLGRRGRLAGPDLVAVGPCPPRVLLIDDVATTGASLAAAAAAVRRAGARRVSASVVAAVTLGRDSPAGIRPSLTRVHRPTLLEVN